MTRRTTSRRPCLHAAQESIERESGGLAEDVADQGRVDPTVCNGREHFAGLAPSQQRRAAARHPELLDPARLQAAASTSTQRSHPPDVNGCEKQRQVN